MIIIDVKVYKIYIFLEKIRRNKKIRRINAVIRYLIQIIDR